MGKFRTNAGSVIWPKLEPMECLTWIFLSGEFACFVAGELSQVIEAMPGSVVSLAMLNKTVIFKSNLYMTLWLSLHINLDRATVLVVE